MRWPASLPDRARPARGPRLPGGAGRGHGRVRDRRGQWERREPAAPDPWVTARRGKAMNVASHSTVRPCGARGLSPVVMQGRSRGRTSRHDTTRHDTTRRWRGARGTCQGRWATSVNRTQRGAWGAGHRRGSRTWRTFVTGVTRGAPILPETTPQVARHLGFRATRSGWSERCVRPAATPARRDKSPGDLHWSSGLWRSGQADRSALCSPTSRQGQP